jgi:hypothetical protein
MSRCEQCPLRAYSEKNPKRLISRIWKWHTGWCPGWKGYLRELEGSAEAERPAEKSPAAVR